MWLGKLIDEGAAEAVEFGDGEVAVAFELVVDRAEFEESFAEATELRGEGFGGEGVFGSLLEKHGRGTSNIGH